MLNRETFPPQADKTYESFFESAMQGTASSRLTPEISLVIRRPLLGCQCCGTTLAVACNILTSEFCSLLKGTNKWKAHRNKVLKGKNCKLIIFLRLPSQ